MLSSWINWLWLRAETKKNFWALLGKVGTFGHPGQFFTPPLRKHTEEWNTWKELKKKKKQFSPDVWSYHASQQKQKGLQIWKQLILKINKQLQIRWFERLARCRGTLTAGLPFYLSGEGRRTTEIWALGRKTEGKKWKKGKSGVERRDLYKKRERRTKAWSAPKTDRQRSLLINGKAIHFQATQRSSTNEKRH